MSKLVGVLYGRKVYDNDPRLFDKLCNADYYAVWNDAPAAYMAGHKCDYCGRTHEKGGECKSCGAPIN